MGRLAIGLVVTLLFIFTRVGYGSNCICIESTVPARRAELLTRYKAVFSGEVIEIKHGDGFDEVKFKVLQSWKGVNSAEVVVGAGGDSYEGVEFETGEKYLVFADGAGTELWNSSCSRTKLLAEARPELTRLGEGKAAGVQSTPKSVRTPAGP